MNFYVDAFYESLNKYNEELCGDKVEAIRNGDSVIVVLADGLGSGVKANILATLTSKIIGTMLERGSEVEEAVDTIAHTLPTCNVRKLAYSTFTILQIFEDGEVYLVEFDNPAAFLIRQGRLLEIPFELRSINGKGVRESRFNIGIGDNIVLVSDGVIHAGVGASLNLGWKWDNVGKYLEENVKPCMPAREICRKLINTCNMLYEERPGDDTTVAAISIRQPLMLNIMVGPPVSKEDDPDMVRQFMSQEGRKVACGGTTAQILARELERELKISMNYYNEAVPPTACIEGIDLVTEGILTLTEVVDIIGDYMSNSRCGIDIQRLNDRDGAAQLARMLMDDCTHLNLYVGRAMNPAHQNPDLPINLSIKLKIVEELARLMEIIGKKVEIYYF